MPVLATCPSWTELTVVVGAGVFIEVEIEGDTVVWYKESGSYGCSSAFVECLRSSCFVSSNLAKRPGSVEDGRRARVGAKNGPYLSSGCFFFSRFQKETRKTATQATSLIVGSLGN